MEDEFKVEYVYNGKARFLYQDMWKYYLKYYGKSKLIRRRALLIGLNLVAVILIWDIYRGTGLYKVITIKKDVYFIWGVILSVTYARILERLGVLLYICKLKSKIKNIEVNELAIVFGNLKIKVIAPDGHSKETDYRYLIEKPDEFVVGGIVPRKKEELKKDEIKFLSEKCDIHTSPGTH